MNDRDALFAAILAHPDEDTPRLAYADYLEENDETKYAEFIRKQIELAKVREWEPLWERTWQTDRDALTGRGFTQFQPQLSQGLTWPTLETFHRGFPWHVQTVEPPPFLGAAEQLFRQIPLQALTVRTNTGGWRYPADRLALFASPHLVPLHQLKFGLTRFNPETARQLRECPHLANLRTLEFEFGTLDAGAGRELLQSPLVEKLESLEFNSTTFSWPELAAAIRAIDSPHRLRRFVLTPFNSMHFSHSHAFDAPFFSTLRELVLNKCEMGENHFRGLCESSAVRQLEMLSLSQTHPGVPGMKVLAGCEALAGLKCLRLSTNRLGPVAMKHLARSPHFSNLQSLDLSSNPLDDKGAIELSRAPWLKNLHSLDLMHCELGDAGAEALADALDPDRVVHVSLYSSSYKKQQSDTIKQKLKKKFGNRLSM